jgi:hypothetical protein
LVRPSEGSQRDANAAAERRHRIRRGRHELCFVLCDQPIDKAIQHLELELKGPARLVMKFGVEALFERATGDLTCHWRTENASAIFAHISNLQARHAPGAPNG